jgi:MFS transporter, DHA3 family, macrolide efflux protein
LGHSDQAISSSPNESSTSTSVPGWKKKVTVFLVGQTISTFGSFLVQYAILWHLTLTTKSGVILALAAIFGFLPQAIVSVFAGVWADRVNRKVMIVISDSVIALSTLGLAFLILSGVDDLWVIFLVMAVRSVGAGVQMPAISALLPQIVPMDKLMRVNGINSSIQSSLGLLAPVAAAAIYSTMSLVAIFFIDVVTAIIGVSLLATIAVPTLARAASLEKPSYFSDMKEGIQYIFGNDLVRWVMAIFGIIGTSILFGVLAISLGFTTNLIVFYSLFFLIGLAVPAFSTSAMTLLQETVEPERQGRVFGFVGIVMAVAMPLGMAILGPLADIVAVEVLLVATGAITVVIATVAVLLPAGKRAIAAAHASTGPEGNAAARNLDH